MGRGFFYTLTLADQFSATFESWDKGLQSAARKADMTAVQMERSAARIATGFGAALMASVPLMAASFIPMEDALARLETVSTTTTGSMSDAMDMALQKAKEWSSQHVQSAVEIIRAQTELATAGLNTEQALAGVAVAAKIATATGDGLAESAQLLASLFNTFGQVGSMKGSDPTTVFEEMGDSLAETIKRFQVQMVPLRQGLSYITGQATVLGLSLNEVNTALGILNTAGIRASQAGTGLQNIFIRMDEAIQKLNLDVMAFTDEAGNFSSISDFVDELARSLEGMSSFDRVIALQDAFGQRAARSAAILLLQRDALRGISAELGTTSGQAAKMQSIIENTTGSRLKIAINNIKNFSQTVGEGLVGAFQLVVGAVGSAFASLTSWAGLNAQAAAATIFLTGAVVAAYGALKIYNAILVMSGAQAVTVMGAFKALSVVFLKFAVVAAVVFAAFTLLSKIFQGRDSIKSGFTGDFFDKGFEPIEKSLNRVASAAAKAEKAIADMARAGKSFPEQKMKDLGFSAEEIANMKGGASAVSQVSRQIQTAFTKTSVAFGATENFGDTIGQQANAAIVSLSELGVKGPEAIRGLSKAVGMLTAIPFGNEVADKWKAILSKTADSEKAFLADAQRITGKTFSSGFEAIMGLRGTDRVQKALHATGAGTHLNPEDLVAALGNFDAAASKSAEQFYSNLGGLLAIARDKALMESLKDVNYDLYQALAKSVTVDGGKIPVADAIYEATRNGDYERTGKTIAGKIFDVFVNSWDNDVSGLDLAATIYDNVKGVTGKNFADLMGGNFGTELGKAFGIQEALSETEGLFSRISNLVKSNQQEMKKGFDSKQIIGFVDNLDQMTKSAGRMRDLNSELLKIAETLKSTLPAAAMGTGVEKAIDEMVASASKGLADWGAQADETRAQMEQLLAFQRVGGNQGRFTEEIIKGGGGAMAEALKASLLTGNLDAFKKSLFESAYDSLQNGIVQGVQNGLLKASQLKALFDVEGISKQVESALANSVNNAGAIDPARLQQNLEPVRIAMQASLAKGMEVLGPIQQVLAGFFQGTGLQVFGEMFSDQRKAAIEEMTNSLRQQEAALGSLQASLYTASEAEKEFVQAQIALQRGSGSVLGQDVGGLDVAGKIALIQDLLTQAEQRGLEGQARAFSDLLAKQFEAMEKAKNMSKAGGLAPEDMAKIAGEVGKIADELSKPIGMREDVASINRDLQSGREAAEGLRDALASIGIGNGAVVPSQITVSGATGASGQISLNFGSTQIVIEAGAAVTESDLDKLRKRLDDEWSKRREELVQAVRLGGFR